MYKRRWARNPHVRWVRDEQAARASARAPLMDRSYPEEPPRSNIFLPDQPHASAVTSNHLVRWANRRFQSEQIPKDIWAEGCTDHHSMCKDRRNRSDKDAHYPAGRSSRSGHRSFAGTEPFPYYARPNRPRVSFGMIESLSF